MPKQIPLSGKRGAWSLLERSPMLPGIVLSTVGGSVVCADVGLFAALPSMGVAVLLLMMDAAYTHNPPGKVAA
jgi:hypothetical protein